LPCPPAFGSKRLAGALDIGSLKPLEIPGHADSAVALVSGVPNMVQIAAMRPEQLSPARFKAFPSRRCAECRDCATRHPNGKSTSPYPAFQALPVREKFELMSSIGMIATWMAHRSASHYAMR
jgi:hypothetical protein